MKINIRKAIEAEIPQLIQYQQKMAFETELEIPFLSKVKLLNFTGYKIKDRLSRFYSQSKKTRKVIFLSNNFGEVAN